MLAPVELTQELFEQYVLAGTCTNAVHGPFADYLEKVRNHALSLNHTIVPQGNHQVNLYLSAPALYKMEYT